MQIAHRTQSLKHRTASDEPTRSVIDHERLIHIVRRFLHIVGGAVERAEGGVVDGSGANGLSDLQIGGELVDSIDGAHVDAARVPVDDEVIEDGVGGRDGVVEGAQHFRRSGAGGPQGQQHAPHGAACGRRLPPGPAPHGPSATRTPRSAAARSHRTATAAVQLLYPTARDARCDRSESRYARPSTVY